MSSNGTSSSSRAAVVAGAASPDVHGTRSQPPHGYSSVKPQQVASTWKPNIMITPPEISPVSEPEDNPRQSHCHPSTCLRDEPTDRQRFMDEESDFFRSLILLADEEQGRDCVDDDDYSNRGFDEDNDVPIAQLGSHASKQAQPIPPVEVPSQQKLDQTSNLDNTGSSFNERTPSLTVPPPCLRKGRRFKSFDVIIDCVRKWHREAFPSRRSPIPQKGRARQGGTYRPYVVCAEHEYDGVQCDFKLAFLPVTGSSDYLVEQATVVHSQACNDHVSARAGRHVQGIDSIGTKQTANTSQSEEHSGGTQNKASEKSHIPQNASSSKRKYSTSSDDSEIVVINKQVKLSSGASSSRHADMSSARDSAPVAIPPSGKASALKVLRSGKVLGGASRTAESEMSSLGSLSVGEEDVVEVDTASESYKDPVDNSHQSTRSTKHAVVPPLKGAMYSDFDTFKASLTVWHDTTYWSSSELAFRSSIYSVTCKRQDQDKTLGCTFKIQLVPNQTSDQLEVSICNTAHSNKCCMMSKYPKKAQIIPKPKSGAKGGTELTIAIGQRFSTFEGAGVAIRAWHSAHFPHNRLPGFSRGRQDSGQFRPQVRCSDSPKHHLKCSFSVKMVPRKAGAGFLVTWIQDHSEACVAAARAGGAMARRQQVQALLSDSEDETEEEHSVTSTKSTSRKSAIASAANSSNEARAKKNKLAENMPDAAEASMSSERVQSNRQDLLKDVNLPGNVAERFALQGITTVQQLNGMNLKEGDFHEICLLVGLSRIEEFVTNKRLAELKEK